MIKVQSRDWHRVPSLVCRVYPKRTSLDKVEEGSILLQDGSRRSDVRMDRVGCRASLYARTDEDEKIDGKEGKSR
jgi:hypothetical protein